jgi:hypothetical protein
MLEIDQLPTADFLAICAKCKGPIFIFDEQRNCSGPDKPPMAEENSHSRSPTLAFETNNGSDVEAQWDGEKPGIYNLNLCIIFAD